MYVCVWVCVCVWKTQPKRKPIAEYFSSSKEQPLHINLEKLILICLVLKEVLMGVSSWCNG